VRIAVAAAGVNFPDTLIIQGLYQFKPPPPFAPGGEVAGRVVEVGASVTSVSVGDRVVGFTTWGGFSEEVVCHAAAVAPIPDDMDDITAGGFTLTYATSHHALKQRGRLKPGETLLVLGAAGGVGVTAVELGKLMGATVIAGASTDAKLEVARKQGADHLINYETEDLKARVKELTNGRGADVVYDPVGGDYTDTAIRCTAWEGRMLVVGFASGAIPRLRANLLLLKGCQAVGVFWGDFVRRDPAAHRANMIELMGWHAAGKLRPYVSEVMPLERASEALRRIMDRQAVGKIVLTTGR